MKTISKKQTGVNVTTAIKAGGLPSVNHNGKLAFIVKSGVKAGQVILHNNHNRRLGVKVTTAIKAGGLPSVNHNGKLAFIVKSGVKAGQVILHNNHNRRLG